MNVGAWVENVSNVDATPLLESSNALKDLEDEFGADPMLIGVHRANVKVVIHADQLLDPRRDSF